MLFNKACCSVVFYYCLEGFFRNPSSVCTDGGWVRGREIVTRSGRTVHTFDKIPYAEPPIGQLRFSDPKPHPGWKGVLDATGDVPSCVQFNGIFPGLFNITTGQEDCLYLSVTTPTTKSSKLLPVMVLFHGEVWSFGSYDVLGPEYLLDEDIVLVRINYRLGALGFLSLESSVVAGNYGLKDQSLGLRWVRRNIGQFCGDRDRVTIFGNGLATHLHMFSPLSKGLFSKSISSSGTGLSPLALVAPGLSRNRSQTLGQLLGCPSASDRELLDCLRVKDAGDIVGAQRKLYESNKSPAVIFGPVLEKPGNGSFILVHPRKSFTPQIPWMAGISSDDGQMWIDLLVSTDPNIYTTLNANFSTFVPITMNIPGNTSNITQIADEIKQFYFGNVTISEKLYQNITDMYTDALFLYPVIESLKRHLGSGFLYYFNYLGQSSYVDAFRKRRILNGAGHGDENIYIFNISKTFPTLTGDDLNISVKMVKLWTNFAKYGIPVPGNALWSWENWKNNKRYMNINRDGLCQRRNLLQQRYEFWSNISIKYQNVFADSEFPIF